MGLFLQMLTVFVTMVSLQGWLPLGCLEEERIALLHLKDALNYPNGTSLPSWIKGDAHCCDWESIICDSSTGRVTELDLEGVRDRELGDWYLNASLFLPFQQLNGLYLTANRIAGLVEKKGGYEQSRLSNLEYLDLGINGFDNSILSYVERLSSLKSLYLNYNRLEGLIDLKDSLSSLERLDLSGNNINKLVASTGGYELTKSSNLEHLDLGYNRFDNSILSFVEGISSLKSLYLDYNRVEGLIDLKESLSGLELLGLNGNNINKLIASRGPSSLSTLWLENITTYGRK
ncbi:hypothetical protein POPTR_001G065318v4 [Populus trichocarpa]|uniref:Uncharacterized protein n=2 Tax=Populus trichocarpa TaxID=3694 RepID=A0ACC0TI23_POPTR|nr:hypothetical protein POPTR_001G065318v4 [Populus trichocarpa]|eukprot:XP_024448575.1 receptor-like protein 15 [Populus trichocarpa]